LSSDWANEYKHSFVDLIAKTPATHKIEYTTLDGATINMVDETFASYLLVNIYEEGKGTMVFGTPITSIAARAFEYCTSLTSIAIPEGVTSIGDSAFFCCNKMTDITIPEGVTSIGQNAFYYCCSLPSLVIPDSVAKIGEGAFFYCSGLESVTIGTGVVEVGPRAFSYCNGLKSVYIKSVSAPAGAANMFFTYTDYKGGYKPIACKMFVPVASLDSYKAAKHWSVYAPQMEGAEF
jgi:hypothetical protein